MPSIKNNKSILKMKEAGKRLSEVFSNIKNENLIDKSTLEIDLLIKSILDKNQLISKAYGYKGFPGYSCLSINDELVHGIPNNKKIIKEGDLLKIDICASHAGYCADMARMYYIGKIEENIVIKKMFDCWNLIFDKILETMKIGNKIWNISLEIEKIIKKNGFSVVKDFCGHGIGKSMHEEPMVPNFFETKNTSQIFYGMALAIEPMFCEKNSELKIDADGWTAKTKDGSLAAHFEDTFIIDNNGVFVTTNNKNF
jgi:methionyl aminopeptidase